ncbi:MAG TPA: hypothetical protein VNA89_16640 [Gemmatimonadaceae bacterium]|nr:hypothetical protein [Gemmatimonadaceae bacterium]
MPAFARLLRAYYYATPLFWLLDVAFGVSVRVAFLDDFAAGRHAYYALCCALGALTFARPRLAPRVAVVEGGANIGMLVVSFFAWYWHQVDIAATDLGVPTAPALGAVANFALSGLAAALGYAGSAAHAARLGARGRA